MENGLTSFLRCAQCDTLYVPSQGINIHTGKKMVYWTKPRPIRKPAPCEHPHSKAERWNGEAWEPITVTDARDGR